VLEFGTPDWRTTLRRLFLVAFLMAVASTGWSGDFDWGVSFSGGPAFLRHDEPRPFGPGTGGTLAVLAQVAPHVETDIAFTWRTWTRDDVSPASRRYLGHVWDERGGELYGVLVWGPEGDVPYGERLLWIGAAARARGLLGAPTRRVRPFGELGLGMGRLSIRDDAPVPLVTRPPGRVDEDPDGDYRDPVSSVGPSLLAGVGVRIRVHPGVSLAVLASGQWMKSHLAAFPDIDPSSIAVDLVLTLHDRGLRSRRAR